jgi:hypothetical protein
MEGFKDEMFHKIEVIGSAHVLQRDQLLDYCHYSYMHD